MKWALWGILLLCCMVGAGSVAVLWHMAHANTELRRQLGGRLVLDAECSDGLLEYMSYMIGLGDYRRVVVLSDTGPSEYRYDNGGWVRSSAVSYDVLSEDEIERLVDWQSDRR